MNPRRTFLLSVPVVVGAASVLPAAAKPKDDPVARELQRQLLKHAKAIRGSRPGEGARSTAATLRLAAVYLRGLGVDAEVAAAARRGQARNVDAYVAAAAAEFGLEPVAVGDGGLERASAALAAGGFTAALERLAAGLEARGADLDRMDGAIRPVIYHDCQPLMDEITFWGGVSAIACQPFSTATVVGGAACAISLGALGAALSAYAWYCW